MFEFHQGVSHFWIFLFTISIYINRQLKEKKDANKI